VYTSGTMTQASPAYYLYNNVIKPFLASATTWFSFVEDYQPNGASTGNTYSTWESSGTTNNTGINWYLVFQYQTPTQNASATVLTIYACEVYNTSGHTWNRTVLTSGSNSSSYSTSLFDAANGRAYTAATPNVVGTGYSPGVSVSTISSLSITTVANSTGQYMLVANADGFLVSATFASSYMIYVGAFTSVLSTVFGTDYPLCAISGAGGTSNYYGINRDPAAVGTAYSYPYFFSNQILGSLAGQVNAGTGDFYQGNGSNYPPTGGRIGLVKNSGSFGPSGYLRGYLPQWVLNVSTAAGVVWGDTITVVPGINNVSGGDTYIYTGVSLQIWVDTAV
jgi:hypothetical protein